MVNLPKTDFPVTPGALYMHLKSNGVYVVIGVSEKFKTEKGWEEVSNVMYKKYNETDKTTYERTIQNFKEEFMPY